MFIDVGRIPSIGHPLVDDAHRQLAQGVNALYEQWSIGAPAADLRAGFELFLRAVGRHFMEEEEIATAAGCPGVELHSAKHRALLDTLTEQVHSLTEGDGADALAGDPRIDVFTLIDQMLYEHEILDDQEYWPVFHCQGAVMSTPAVVMEVEWSAALETGHVEMDRQHRILCEMVNVLAATIVSGAGREEAGAVFARIVELARLHFQWEERQMEAFGVAEAGLHALLHRQLLADLTGALDAFRRGDLADLFEVPGRLRIWFADHILHADGEIASVMAASPAPALQG